MWLAMFTMLALAEPPQELEAVVLLVQGGSTCAGVLVEDEGLVATAYHCVSSGGRPLVRLRDGTRALGRVIAARPARDLALVEVPALAGHSGLEIRATPPEVGETVRALGHPFGAQRPGGFLEGTLQWSLSEGVVSSVGTQALQITAPINPGNSGGPVVDDEGRIVGIVSRRLQGDGMGFATRAEHLLPLRQRPRGWAQGGGTLSLMPFASAWEGQRGTFSVGGLVEVSVRDRVFAAGSLGFAPNARWEAVSFGRADWLMAELQGGVRQRAFRGFWSSSLDLYGGLAVLASTQATGDTLRVRTTRSAAPLVGAGLRVGKIGLSGAAVWRPEDGWSVRGTITYRWPGVLTVF